MLSEIRESNDEIIKLLEEIKFFNWNPIDIISGFFSHGFSEKDQLNWNRIEKILGDIYDNQHGKLKEIQDYFLFKIDKMEILELVGRVGRETLTFEEELFFKSILVKGYLNNFRQLILPFNEVDDEILIKFKKSHLEQMKTSTSGKNNPNLENDIKNIENEIKNLETQNRIDVSFKKITTYLGKFNTDDMLLRTMESTVKHFAYPSFDTNLSRVLREIAKLSPIISFLIEAGTQFNNNNILFNYEKI